ncbi:Glutathione S-transferase, C-terminal domain containing protein [Novymonas esmeraldas]|uniref:Glutathione S-transferase, C-terminal domain containing protein n=1 Tax=Novymonas esmeraldas TaxID=1808958 RepID=A0AAW0EJV0_9TRYP
MVGRPAATPFRVFGSPYTLTLHQHVTYLRLKQLPFRVYCTNITTSLLYSLYYRARSVFCTLTPSGASPLQVWQLAEAAELDEDLEAIARTSKGEVHYSLSGKRDRPGGVDGGDGSRTQRILIRKETHPQLHLASWCVVVYACWWLAKTGAMFRYVRGESRDVLEGYGRYFFLIPGVGFARAMAPRFRQIMQRIVAVTGVSEVTAPFMEEHFQRFCTALEAHLREHPTELFLLCTPHPTLADVTLGAAFSSFFLMDDPPASMLAEKFPCLMEYVERVTGWRGSTFVGTAVDAEGEASMSGTSAGGAATGDDGSSREYPDSVPESLAPCFALIAEVLPFLMSQCASFNAYMAGDGILALRREPLEGEWKGCSGYLLPQLPNIRALMIVDDNVCSVAVRSQDLEVAFLAAREVHDDSLHDFGRREDGARSAHGTGAGSPEATAPTAPSNDATKDSGSTAVTAVDEASGQQQDDVGGEDDVVTAAAQFRAPIPLNTMRAEEADFYRVYSAASRFNVAGTATSLSEAVASARQTAGAGGTAVATRGSVTEHLATLRIMLAKMTCPQYTLTSLPHGRRLYVAAIPEHEVAKVRQARKEAASSATVA